MRVFVTYPENSKFQHWESIYVPRFVDDLRGNPGEHSIAPDAAEADVIVLFESNMHKPRDQDERLLAEPLLRQGDVRSFAPSTMRIHPRAICADYTPPWRTTNMTRRSIAPGRR